MQLPKTPASSLIWQKTTPEDDFALISVANMASEGKEPPDRILTKYYKCHPRTKVGAVLCLVCENFFHTSEIVTKYNAGNPLKIISNSLIVCHDHPNVALTSNLPYGELSSKAKQLIATKSK